MAARRRGASGLVAGLVVVVMASSCSSPAADESARSTLPSSTTPPTTTTTIPSLLPSEGTIPLPELANARLADDLIQTARRAVAAWEDSPVECYESKAEALAARDQFARVATYLAKTRIAARDLGDVTAFKDTIAVEAAYRTYAATRRFITCKAAAAQAKPSGTTTTVVGGTTKGLTAGGVVEVDLTINGNPVVDQEFTVSDAGAPCDGVGANTTFLVSSQDATGRWVITDVVVNTDGATSAIVIPPRAGSGAIEYLAYCGTQDKRHGVTTYRVRTTGDTTTTAPPPTTTNPDAPLVVIDLPLDDGTLLVDSRATEVAIEPESVTKFLAASGAEGGVVVARLNLGDWIALREGQVSWLPVGPGDEGLETKIVGAKTPVERTIRVTAPTTTTTSTLPVATSALPATDEPTSGGSSSETDSTIWVIAILLGLATLAVATTRARQRR